MSARDDGGPAFAVNSEEDRCGNVLMYAQQGMSLRDYFAAAFLQGVAARDLAGTAEERAEAAYHVADAMLAERAK